MQGSTNRQNLCKPDDIRKANTATEADDIDGNGEGEVMPGMRARTVSEHDEQVAVFQWADLKANQDERYSMMFAIPNGGHRHHTVAAKLQAEGVRSGVPDIFLAVPSGTYHGLWIEMKRIGGKSTDNQQGWIVALRKQGYAAEICEGFEAAKRAIETYLEFPEHFHVVESEEEALGLMGVK
jgi:hypothetical protein